MLSTSNRTSFNLDVINTSSVGRNQDDITEILNILNQRNMQSYSIILEGENYELDDGTFTPITFSTGMGSIVDNLFGVPISFKRANIDNVKLSIVGDFTETITIYGDNIDDGIVIDINTDNIFNNNGVKYLNYDHKITGVLINSNNNVNRSVFIDVAGTHISSYVKIRIAVNIVNFGSMVETYNIVTGSELNIQGEE